MMVSGKKEAPSEEKKSEKNAVSEQPLKRGKRKAKQEEERIANKKEIESQSIAEDLKSIKKKEFDIPESDTKKHTSENDGGPIKKIKPSVEKSEKETKDKNMSLEKADAPLKKKNDGIVKTKPEKIPKNVTGKDEERKSLPEVMANGKDLSGEKMEEKSSTEQKPLKRGRKRKTTQEEVKDLKKLSEDCSIAEDLKSINKNESDNVIPESPMKKKSMPDKLDSPLKKRSASPEKSETPLKKRNAATEKGAKASKDASEKVGVIKKNKNATIVESQDHKGLPEGWSRKDVVRKSGKTAGQVDVYIYSPEGMKFRSKPDVAAYLKKTKSSLKLENFDFSKRKGKDSKSGLIKNDDSKSAKTSKGKDTKVKSPVKSKAVPSLKSANRKGKNMPVKKEELESPQKKSPKKVLIKLNVSSPKSKKRRSVKGQVDTPTKNQKAVSSTSKTKKKHE